VILVPGCRFFTAIAPLAAGTAEKELPGLAALALEADSPFADAQLARGYFAAPQAGGLVVFAALRRMFAAEQETWAQAGFVVPDFATWLPRAETAGCIVVLETPEAVTALEFAAGSALPRRIVSRPVPAAPGGAEGATLAREQALARIEPAGRRVRRYRLGEVACTVRGGRYRFHWEAQDSASEKTDEGGALTADQLWAMDLREPEFLRTRRRDFQWNRYAWATLAGLGAAAALLVAAEVGLLGARVLNARRQARIEAQTAAARQSEDNSDIVARLAGYIDRKPQPLELLAYVNDLRPRAIYFTKVSVEGGLQVVIDGSTSSLAVVNEFEAALKRSPAFASVEVKNIRTREGGGTFQLVLAFRPGFPVGPVSSPVTGAAGGSPTLSAPAVLQGVPPAPPAAGIATGQPPRRGPKPPASGDPGPMRPNGPDLRGPSPETRQTRAPEPLPPADEPPPPPAPEQPESAS